LFTLSGMASGVFAVVIINNGSCNGFLIPALFQLFVSWNVAATESPYLYCGLCGLCVGVISFIQISVIILYDIYCRCSHIRL
jgi:hypothetical protein